MAYRRKQGTLRSATFVDDRRGVNAGVNDGGGSSAIQTRSAHRHSSSLSSACDRGPGFYSSDCDRLTRSMTYTSPKDTTEYEYTSLNILNESKYGFWGILARKAKSIIEDDSTSQQYEDHGRNLSQNTRTKIVGQFDQSNRAPDNFRKTENPAVNRSSESIASSLHQIRGTLKKSLEEGLTMVESRTSDIIQETKKLQIRRKGATDLSASNALPQNQNDNAMQLKASRDVANAMAAKSKILIRELKTVKADLAFAKERCTQLEEENKLLHEGRQKGENNREDEDLIRLQLETLLEEKGRLAHENSVYARENNFLREIVEYHQLTMQDVIYVNEGTDEFSEVSPWVLPKPSSVTECAAVDTKQGPA